MFLSHPWGPFVTIAIIIISLWSCLIAWTGSTHGSGASQKGVYGFVSDVSTGRRFSLLILLVWVQMFHQNLELWSEKARN